MAKLDRKVSAFLNTIRSDVQRTSVESLLDRAESGFGAGLTANSFRAQYLLNPPTPDDLDTAARSVEFFAHRFGLALSHLKMLMDESCLNRQGSEVHVRSVGATVSTLPSMSTGLGNRLRRRRPKGK